MKSYCPHCGADVTNVKEMPQVGIICPKCHNDFWSSETIKGSDIKKYKYEPKYNLMIRLPESDIVNRISTMVMDEAEEEVGGRMHDFIEVLNQAQVADWQRLGYTHSAPPTYSFTKGGKFFKVIKTDESGSRSVYCFVDKSNGDIYKAAGWAQPAKGVRSNIEKVISGEVKHDPYGGWLYVR